MSNTEIIPASEAIIARQENIQTIVQAGPQSYQTNSISCQRCNEFGQNLLAEVQTNGMSDELDGRIASFIEKAKRTVKAMNERRSPVTKLFDQVRSEFTVLENQINPTVKDTIPYQLQQYRNTYAAKKREEEERRRAEEAARQEALRVKESYRQAVADDYQKSFNALLNSSINSLTELNNSVNLENYKAVYDTLSGYSVVLPSEWCPPSSVRLPYNLEADEARQIRQEVFSKMLPNFEAQYTFDIEDYCKELLDRLPSKRTELERAAAASAEEAAHIKAEMARKEAEAAAAKEAERRKAEQAAAAAAELEKNKAEMVGLFNAGKAEEQAYTSKAKVSKKCKITDPQAVAAIVSMWWQYEGVKLSVDELSKIFKKQITFCEKLATKENIFVNSIGLEYIDDVKAQ